MEPHAQARIQILLATFNGAKYLREQLDSIARQSHREWSLLVADDGSTDATVAIIEQFGAQFPGRVRLLTTTPVGSAKHNFFRLMREPSAGQYVALCDQDDVWHENKLARLVAACIEMERRHPGRPCAVYSDLEVVDEFLRMRSPSFVREIRTDPALLSFGSLLVENSIPGCAMLLNRSLLEKFNTYTGPLDDAIMHDWWIALLASATGRLGFVPDALVQYRQHHSNAAGSVRRGGVKFVMAKLSNLRNDTPAQTLRQAKLFNKAYAGHAQRESAELLSIYTEFDRLGKASRAWRCATNGILKQSLTRRIYQLVKV